MRERVGDARAGEVADETFEALYRQRYRDVYRYVLLMLRSADEAEDELTEALEKTGAAYAGRVTERSRRLFYFVAAEGEAATKLVEFWAKAHKAWSPRLEVKNDPKWTFRTALFG